MDKVIDENPRRPELSLLPALLILKPQKYIIERGLHHRKRGRKAAGDDSDEDGRLCDKVYQSSIRRRNAASEIPMSIDITTRQASKGAM